ncbi:MAG: fructosamine kinase family protein [Armatimonadota bacterium]
MSSVGSPADWVELEILAGGQVGDVRRVRTPVGDAVLKRKEGAPEGFHALEAAGLDALRAAGGPRVPRVLAVDAQYLLLEYLSTAPPDNPERFSRGFARDLASVHRNPGPSFGWDTDNFLGSQVQPNRRCADWAEFYRDRRILPQMERADRAGRMSGARRARLMRIVDAFPAVLADWGDPPSLIHGDLWAGNFLALPGDAVAVIDPAVHHAPREMEIAYIELFGGFPPDFVRNYEREWPLDPGYARRRPIHWLYPLLIHLNHFGETYGPALDAACDEAAQAWGISG